MLVLVGPSLKVTLRAIVPRSRIDYAGLVRASHLCGRDGPLMEYDICRVTIQIT